MFSQYQSITLINFSSLSLLLLLLGALSANLHSSAKDEVTELHGLDWKPPFKHYSGYLDAGNRKLLHYWFVESQYNPSKDPVVLWLNGGPGCSSMEGMLSENGPFTVTENSTLVKNDFSWNLFSNVLYLESPAGVGFSYSTDGNYTTSDDEVSLQNFNALKSFFKKFPEFSKNDFYITGESYAGIYLPTLAIRLIKDDEGFNFKGMAVGNGLSSYSMNYNSIIYFAYNHGLIGEELFLELVRSCCRDGNSTLGNCNFQQLACTSKFNEVMDILSTLNIYNLYDKCYPNNNNNNNNNANNNKLDHDQILHQQKLYRKNLILNKYFKFSAGFMKFQTPISPLCTDDRPITTFLNNPQTRIDLHIPDFVQQFSLCTSLNYIRVYENMTKQYLELLKSKKYRVLVYNGDIDMACNFMGDQWFVQSLGLKVVDKRQEWFYKDLKDSSEQVAGFYQKFQNLTFATVKGSGHMVPTDKPYQALIMFANFLAGIF